MQSFVFPDYLVDNSDYTGSSPPQKKKDVNLILINCFELTYSFTTCLLVSTHWPASSAAADPQGGAVRGAVRRGAGGGVLQADAPSTAPRHRCLHSSYGRLHDVVDCITNLLSLFH